MDSARGIWLVGTREVVHPPDEIVSGEVALFYIGAIFTIELVGIGVHRVRRPRSDITLHSDFHQPVQREVPRFGIVEEAILLQTLHERALALHSRLLESYLIGRMIALEPDQIFVADVADRDRIGDAEVVDIVEAVDSAAA